MTMARTAMIKTSSMSRCEVANEHTADVKSLSGDLGAVLGQLFELHVQSVEAHAHFVGTQFIAFQRQLEAVVHTAREASGAVAESSARIGRRRPCSLTIAGVRPGLPGLRPGERCSTAASIAGETHCSAEELMVWRPSSCAPAEHHRLPKIRHWNP